MFSLIIYCGNRVEHMFDQNATIKESDEDEDDLASEMVQIEPGILFDLLNSSFKYLNIWLYFFSISYTLWGRSKLPGSNWIGKSKTLNRLINVPITNKITDGLSGTQIIVTASTPMVEHEFRCFDAVDETVDEKGMATEQDFSDDGMEPPPPPAPEPSTAETLCQDQPLPPFTPGDEVKQDTVSKGFEDEFVELETAKESYA